MKKALKTGPENLYYYASEGRREGPNPNMTGNCSGLSGNFDECEITDAERAEGVLINYLIAE